MGQLAKDIHDAASVIPAAPVSGPADLLTGPDLLGIFAKVEEAVATLELVQRGARIVCTAGRPDDVANGEDGDLGLNTTNGDLWAKDGGAWVFVLNLKGAPGTNATGQTGLSAYQLALQQGFSGSLDQWLASLGRAGSTGMSAYQAAVAGGYVGTVSQWLESLKGNPGDPGKDAVITDDSITNRQLGPDVKIGSVSAAGNAYPAADRTGLTTVEKFLVWIGPKVTDLFTRIGALDTGFGSLSTLVNGFNARLSALEARPTGGSGTGTGTANFPAQSASTAGKFLKSSGTAGGESWDTPLNNKVGWLFNFKNELTRDQRYFKATQIISIEKDVGISTLSYSINGGTAVNVVFTSNLFAPDANTPLTFPAQSFVTWSITYTTNYTVAAFEVVGTEIL